MRLTDYHVQNKLKYSKPISIRYQRDLAAFRAISQRRLADMPLALVVATHSAQRLLTRTSHGQYSVFVITSKQILRATGLKSPKTLTRWANAGIIPRPAIGTHPKGKGKMGFWPDWVLERCRQIAKLQRQGHSLRSAATLIEHDRMLGIIERVKESPNLSAMLSEKKIELTRGGEIDLGSLLHLFIVKGAENVVTDITVMKKIAAEMRTAGVAAKGVQYLQAGYNPICIFDGQNIVVVPDILVGQMLSENAGSSSWVMIPLFAPLQKAFSSLGLSAPKAPAVRPAPKMRRTEGDVTIEYDFLPVGCTDFEVLRETGKTILAPRK